VLFLALDPAQFAGSDLLMRNASELAEYVRGCPRAEGVDAIVLPGDPERSTLLKRTAEGIPIEDAHWTRLTDLAGRLNVAEPALPAG
jgi:hydroxycarboxylate dehydrogenase B